MLSSAIDQATNHAASKPREVRSTSSTGLASRTHVRAYGDRLVLGHVPRVGWVGQNRWMRVILSGANPGVRLFDGEVVTAYASVWVVDWSERGSGRAIVLWHAGTVRVLADNADLGRWLERDFTRHFPEADGLAWPEPAPEQATVDVHLDLAHGLTARAGDVEVTMSGILDRRAFQTDEFPLGGVPHGLRLVSAPTKDATIHVGGQRLAGTVTTGGDQTRPTSSAFLATAEVWLR